MATLKTRFDQRVLSTHQFNTIRRCERLSPSHTEMSYTLSSYCSTQSGKKSKDMYLNTTTQNRTIGAFPTLYDSAGSNLKQGPRVPAFGPCGFHSDDQPRSKRRRKMTKRRQVALPPLFASRLSAASSRIRRPSRRTRPCGCGSCTASHPRPGNDPSRCR